MNRQDALNSLNAASAQDRLASVRALYDTAEPRDLSALRARLADEDDSWVQTALRRTIYRIQSGGRVEVRHWIALPEQEQIRDLKAQAVEEVSKMMLHEVRKILGAIDLDASSEVKNYDSSQTRVSVERMRSLLTAIQSLHDASITPQLDEVNLTALIDEVVRNFQESDDRILLARSDAVAVIVDPHLIKLALDNTIRNGVEACDTADSTVTINWGVTDRDGWIMVLDDGVGLPEGFAEAATPGTTTKSRMLHLGWGLTITRQAMASLNGTVELKPRQGRGTSCELRWTTGRDIDEGPIDR